MEAPEILSVSNVQNSAPLPDIWLASTTAAMDEADRTAKEIPIRFLSLEKDLLPITLIDYGLLGPYGLIGPPTTSIASGVDKPDQELSIPLTPAAKERINLLLDLQKDLRTRLNITPGVPPYSVSVPRIRLTPTWTNSGRISSIYVEIYLVLHDCRDRVSPRLEATREIQRNVFVGTDIDFAPHDLTGGLLPVGDPSDGPSASLSAMTAPAESINTQNMSAQQGLGFEGSTMMSTLQSDTSVGFRTAPPLAAFSDTTGDLSCNVRLRHVGPWVVRSCRQEQGSENNGSVFDGSSMATGHGDFAL